MQKLRWPKVLDAVARRLTPVHGRTFRGADISRAGISYYWSAFPTEGATDTAFASPFVLATFYPQLVRGAIATYGTQDVLRFQASGRTHGIKGKS